MNTIILKKIDESNFIDAFNLELQDSQERFVSHRKKSGRNPLNLGNPFGFSHIVS